MAYSICPDCDSEVFSDNYVYTGNHAAYDKGYENSGFKIIGYRFHCRNEIEVNNELCECDTSLEDDI